jgi:hypothetical protein
MQTQPLTPDLANKPPQPEAVDDSEVMLKFKRVLIHFVEIGDEFAEMVRQEARMSIQAQSESAKRNPDPEFAAPLVVPPHITDFFERITRSVRRSMVLYQKLNEPPKTPSPDRSTARRRIIRDVEDAIQSKAAKGEQEKLNVELVERLERPEFDDELANRSIAEIVTEICRDLGIAGLHASNPWKRRTPVDIAILNARAAQRYGEVPSPEIAALLGQRVPHPNDS